jgi:S1-C subfamily serine protease
MQKENNLSTNKITQILLIAFTVLLIISLSQFFYHNDNKFVSASEKAIRSVVTIHTSSNKNILSNRYASSKNIGSGVIISEDGHVVTNSHLLIPNGKIIIGHTNGEMSEGVLVGRDDDSDLAVIKTDVDFSMVPIEIGNSSGVRIGDKVLAIGNPYNIGLSVTSGIISATGRDYGNPYLELIQTDAAINPGNSGGALINEEGYLVGINTKIYSQTGSYEGLGFAIPSEKVFQVASELIRYGKVRNAWIGNFRVKQIRFLDNNQTIGLQIIEIGKKGPLINAGINQGDIIIGINDDIGSWKNLTEALRLVFPGDIIKLEFFTKETSEQLLLEIKTEPLNQEDE